MTFIAAAVAGATALTGVYAANKAAGAQKDASAAQVALQKDIYDKSIKRANNAGKKVSERNVATRKTTLKAARDERKTLGDYAKAERDRGLGLADTVYGRNMDVLTGTRDDVLADLRRAKNKAIGAQQPYYDQGTNALDAYAYNLGIGDKPAGYSGLELSAGAQFLLNQGRKDVEGGAASAGGLYSGNTLKALEDLRAGTVATDRDNQMAQLYGLAGMGQTAAGNISNIQTTMGGQIADARGRYAGAIAGLNDQDYSRRAGLNSDFYDNMGRATVGFTDRVTNAENTFADRVGNNWWNWVSAGQNAGQNYASGTANALASYGQAAANGWINTANAVTGGAENFASIYGTLGGKFGNENLAQGSGWPMNQAPMARPA